MHHTDVIASLYNIYFFWYLRLSIQPKAKKLVRQLEHDASMVEYEKELSFLKRRLDAIPYDLPDVRRENIRVGSDEDSKYSYGIYEGKRLFFPKGSSLRNIRTSLYTLCREQSAYSPHRYVDQDFPFARDTQTVDVLIDCGCAEGNFSLMYAKKSSSIYLIEPNDAYMTPLSLSFQEYKEKVHVIKRCISDKDSEKEATLDSLFDFKGKTVFLKMDLEGFGLNALKGARRLLRENDCRVACACYHTTNEADQIEKYLMSDIGGYKISYTKGYMFMYFEENFHYPYFRKGMLRAERV